MLAMCWEQPCFKSGRTFSLHIPSFVPCFLVSVLGIRDILVRIRIRLLSSVILRKQKNYIYIYIFFLITCPEAHYLHSKKFNFLPKLCVKNLFCRHYFSPLNTFMRKGKDPEPVFGVQLHTDYNMTRDRHLG